MPDDGICSWAEVAPGASYTKLLATTGWPDGKETVLVVGHQPTLGQVASFVLTGEASEWSIKKAGVWWLTNRARDEGMSASLRAVVSPDYL